MYVGIIHVRIEWVSKHCRQTALQVGRTGDVGAFGLGYLKRFATTAFPPKQGVPCSPCLTTLHTNSEKVVATKSFARPTLLTFSSLVLSTGILSGPKSCRWQCHRATWYSSSPCLTSSKTLERSYQMSGRGHENSTCASNHTSLPLTVQNAPYLTSPRSFAGELKTL